MNQNLCKKEKKIGEQIVYNKKNGAWCNKYGTYSPDIHITSSHVDPVNGI